jgi:hypothetical protein
MQIIRGGTYHDQAFKAETTGFILAMGDREQFQSRLIGTKALKTKEAHG